MSLFSWFTRKTASPKTGYPSPADSPKPGAPSASSARNSRSFGDAVSPDPAAHRKNERMERREFLYTVVRDAMVRAGVLSASYKFKVLSLDQRGSQFLIMMDLAREFGGDTGRLSEIEALIAQTAKSRYEISVTAVYWRVNDHVAVGIPLRNTTSTGAVPFTPRAEAPGAAPIGAIPSPRPGSEVHKAVAARALPNPQIQAQVPQTPPKLPAVAVPAVKTPERSAASVFDPIEADEVLAFRKALGNTNAGNAASAPGVAVRTGPKRRPLGDDFADTEMTNNDAPASDLSGTQYGDL